MKKETSALLDTIYRSVEDLHAEIDRHHALMVGVLTDNLEPGQLEQLLDACHSPSLVTLKTSLTEAIDDLEESRKAFKSKQLEVLRKKLMKVLLETDQACLATANHSKSERLKK